MKGPRIIVDFTDELARQLCSPMVRDVIKEVLLEEASLDAKAAADFLDLSESEFRRRAKKKIPVIDYGERSARYTLKDLIAYRETNRITPRLAKTK